MNNLTVKVCTANKTNEVTFALDISSVPSECRQCHCVVHSWLCPSVTEQVHMNSPGAGPLGWFLMLFSRPWALGMHRLCFCPAPGTCVLLSCPSLSTSLPREARLVGRRPEAETSPHPAEEASAKSVRKQSLNCVRTQRNPCVNSHVPLRLQDALPEGDPGDLQGLKQPIFLFRYKPLSVCKLSFLCKTSKRFYHSRSLPEKEKRAAYAVQELSLFAALCKIVWYCL